MRKTISSADAIMLLASALLLTLLLFAGLGDIALINFNEARRAVTVREMLGANDWLIPLMNGAPYLTKPPLFYWMVLLTSSLRGTVDEWTVRFPSAVFGAVNCLWVYWLGTRLRNHRAGLLAAIFTMTNAGFSLHARSAEVEMTLAGLCVSSLMIAAYVLLLQPADNNRYRRWILLSYTLIGAGVLTKGPVSFIFTALPIAIFWLLDRNAKAATFVTSIGGWLLVILVGSSWFLAVSLRDGFGVWRTVIQNDILNKISSNSPADPWYSYIVYMLGDFFPFWIILLVRPKQWWRQMHTVREYRFLACAIFVPLLMLSLFSAKNPKYMLPMYPWLALLLALRWEQVLMSLSGWRQRAMFAVPTVMLAGFVIFYLFGAPHVLAHRVRALPRIAATVMQKPDLPAYHLGEPDMRLVFYVGKPVKAVNLDQIASIPMPAWLFATMPVPAELQALSACEANRFESYLSKHRELVLYQLDQTCMSKHDSVLH